MTLTWTDAEREAVKHAIASAGMRGQGRYVTRVDAALAALAPFIEARIAEAREAGMREAVNVALATSDSMTACEIAAAIIAAIEKEPPHDPR